MEYVYVILGLVVWFAIYSFFNKIYLDKTFKKFEMGEDKRCFKPSLNQVLLFSVFPNAALIAGMAYYFYSIDKLDFYQLLFIFIVLPAIAIVYIYKPLKAIKGDYQITLKDNIAEFKSTKDIRIDLSKCNAINETRQTSRRFETYSFKIDGKEVTINFNDFVLGVYAERIVELMKTETIASIQH